MRLYVVYLTEEMGYQTVINLHNTFTSIIGWVGVFKTRIEADRYANYLNNRVSELAKQ